LFDFDGIAVKSMEQHFEAWSKAFRKKNIEIDRIVFFLQEGQGLGQLSKALGDEYGLTQTQLGEIIEDKQKYYKQICRIEIYDGFIDLLEILKQNNIPMGIVTGGNRQRVIPIIRDLYKNYIEAVVSVEDTERGKPYPDPFIKGAQMLRIPAENCIVVENAPKGIQAAKKAGMYVTAVKTTLTEEYLFEADEVVTDFFELRPKIEKLLEIDD